MTLINWWLCSKRTPDGKPWIPTPNDSLYVVESDYQLNAKLKSLLSLFFPIIPTTNRLMLQQADQVLEKTFS